MAIKGTLNECSVEELLTLIDTGKRTGRLTIRVKSESSDNFACYQFWVKEGRFVGAIDCQNHKDLRDLIKEKHVNQYHDVSSRVANKLFQWAKKVRQPLGIYLKDQGLLKTWHLQSLFHQQVIDKINYLLDASEGDFIFNSGAEMPCSQLTGISIPATELAQKKLIVV
jgi:hypothetical protein